MGSRQLKQISHELSCCKEDVFVAAKLKLSGKMVKTKQ